MTITPQVISRLGIKLVAASFLGAALFAQPVPVQAAGSDTPKCPTGQVWDKKKGKCKPAPSHIEDMSDDQLYAHGWKLAKSGQYTRAIEVLKAADQSDPRVLNYLGYSYRKSGDLDTAIGYYKAALQINPDFVLAREYLGEGYVKAGRLDLARLELEQIGKRCGKGCKEYVELASVISGTDKATW